MTVYCNVCNWKIGQVTFENKDKMLLKYANHFVQHTPEQIVKSICWTAEKKK